MFKTTFRRLMFTIISILLCCFVVSYFVLVFYTSGYAIEQKSQALRETGRHVATLTENYVSYTTVYRNTTGLDELYANGITAIASATGSDILIIDSNSGSVMAMSRNIPSIPSVIPTDILFDLKNGSATDKLSDYFNTETLTVYTPIQSGMLQNCGILTCMPRSRATDAFLSFMRTIILVFILICLAGLVIIYFVSKRMTASLRSLNETAKKIASGDFEARAKVIGNDEISNLARTFNAMAASLRELNNTQTSFIANVSHELRTPMTTISGFIENILNGTISEDRRSEYLEIVLSEVGRLSRMVTDMLDISKMSLGQFTINKSKFDICELTRLTIIKFENRIDEKSLDISVDIPDKKVSVIADKDAITRVITNIFDNAIKFSDDGGYINISVSTKQDKAYIAITNDGVGIEEDAIPYVFDRFYKTDSSRHNKNGTGLGLYMVKNIINMHGENIAVQSMPLPQGDYESGVTPTRRTTFVFTLALA